MIVLLSKISSQNSFEIFFGWKDEILKKLIVTEILYTHLVGPIQIKRDTLGGWVGTGQCHQKTQGKEGGFAKCHVTFFSKFLHLGLFLKVYRGTLIIWERSNIFTEWHMGGAFHPKECQVLFEWPLTWILKMTKIENTVPPCSYVQDWNLFLL
jgi:hypothetical protein